MMHQEAPTPQLLHMHIYRWHYAEFASLHHGFVNPVTRGLRNCALVLKLVNALLKEFMSTVLVGTLMSRSLPLTIKAPAHTCHCVQQRVPVERMWTTASVQENDT